MDCDKIEEGGDSLKSTLVSKEIGGQSLNHS